MANIINQELKAKHSYKWATVTFEDAGKTHQVDIDEDNIIEFIADTMDRSELIAQTEVDYSQELSDKDLAVILVDMFGWQDQIEAYIDSLSDSELEELEIKETKIVNLNKTKAA
ncbi:MAG: hypothetical protein K0S09_58 [Sphingobacteriaceae bacterium]|jgi:hypothetical protein|nr:hypothetical protein [Sphingobacteriaceae bacterium]